jgi:ABC-type transport system involved in Fe-S cluster assembly fused permease/ATPase subunit
MPVHERADLIIVLNDGQVAETGKYHELIQRQGYYTHLHQRNMAAGR